jgi:hypothetical protein
MLRTVELTTLTAAGSSVSNDVIAGEMLGAYVSYEGAGTMTLTCSTTGAAAIGYGSGYPAETVIPFVDNLAMTTNSTGTASATLVVRV